MSNPSDHNNDRPYSNKQSENGINNTSAEEHVPFKTPKMKVTMVQHCYTDEQLEAYTKEREDAARAEGFRENQKSDEYWEKYNDERIKERERLARIDELQDFEWNDAHMYVRKRLAELENNNA